MCCYLILRYCLAARWVYWMRTVPPSMTAVPAQIHDRRMQDSLAALLDMPAATLPLHARYVSTVSGTQADTELYPLYLGRDTAVHYVLYLIVSEREADTDCIQCIIQQIHCIVHLGPYLHW